MPILIEGCVIFRPGDASRKTPKTHGRSRASCLRSSRWWGELFGRRPADV